MVKTRQTKSANMPRSEKSGVNKIDKIKSKNKVEEKVKQAALMDVAPGIMNGYNEPRSGCCELCYDRFNWLF